MHYTANIADMNKNGGKLSVKTIGTKDASVFHGFCSKHDRELFSCIENEAFSGRPDQCLAVAYRAMSRELYGKDALSHIRETLRGADKGKSHAEQLLLQAILDELNRSNEAARIVRRQSFWNQWLPKLRESLAHLFGLIMRRAGGDASVALRVFSV
ncbi:hypothetical protein QEZ52_16825 [Aliisedimentitalea scapharcae]|uniref:Uncharacterized protein n=1 Tax=Aliisedimentitalea scapharcae TaxID=1524259 RepID=A0ABZ2XQ77_9RHOB